jgi:hypothetical protein
MPDRNIMPCIGPTVTPFAAVVVIEQSRLRTVRLSTCKIFESTFRNPARADNEAEFASDAT